MLTQEEKATVVLGMSYDEDIKQDFLLRELEAGEKEFVSKSEYRRYAHSCLSKLQQNHTWTENNRRRLEQEHAADIIRNATPTLSDRSAGSPEEFIDCEQTLSQRWRSLSPFLQTVAKRQFFGYEETVEKTARDLGTTVAAINMARTRIKQVLNGVKA